MKKQHYPASLLIGKTKYRLDLVSHIEEIDGNITRGYCEAKEKLITLLDKQSDADLFSTLIHEALHAIEAEHKVKLKHKTIYALEGPLSAFLLKNFFIIPRR